MTPAMEALRNLHGFKAAGKNQWEARCPGHDDRRASLSISEGDDGRILLHCHAGCEIDRVLESLRLRKRDLFSQNGDHRDNGNHRNIVATYNYLTTDGKLAYQVVRYEPKDFRQRHPDGNGGWIWNMEGIERIPYNLPEVTAAEYVFVVEGEKDAEGLRKIGLTATCNTGGAGKWNASLSRYFNSRQFITIIPDKDKPGREHARQVAALLHGVVASVKIMELPGNGKDVSDWLEGRDPTEAAEELSILADAAPEWDPQKDGPIADDLAGADPGNHPTSAVGVSLEDFYAYAPMHQYIFIPTRDLWPSASVNARVVLKNEKGELGTASAWLDRNRAVEQMTWAPGMPMIITNRLISDGGWIKRDGVTAFNLYMPPQPSAGDPAKAGPWLDHVYRIYGDHASHIIMWNAHRVQRPQEKVNHAIVLGGLQGIGKDTLLEPVKHAIGPWNFCEVSPSHLLGRFNGFVKSVILRISEARDLGDVDRYGFYDHLKAYTAAPPDVLRCDEKNIREYAVLNVCGVVITTNHKTDGIFLPADDRRHYVAWSDLTKDDFPPDYWTKLYKWYEREGYGHVAAYLQTLDISTFDPKAPPPKTEAFYAIVDANRAPEDAELADAIDARGNPDALTLLDIIACAGTDFASWLKDRRNSRQIPHRLEAVGYVAVRNPSQKRDGLWKIGGKSQVVYAKQELCPRDRIAAAQKLTGWR